MKERKYAEDLSHIRSMMEQSTKFLSLSGLSGVVAGTLALIGAYLAHLSINAYMYDLFLYESSVEEYQTMRFELMSIGVSVLCLSLGFGYLLSVAKARKRGEGLWNPAAFKMLYSLMVPLSAGGVVCFAFLYYGLIVLVAPVTLIFYGMALINASKYTLREVHYLGLCQLALGLISLFYLGYGIYFWAIGFGVLHIVYGSIMYFRHDRT